MLILTFEHTVAMLCDDCGVVLLTFNYHGGKFFK